MTDATTHGTRREVLRWLGGAAAVATGAMLLPAAIAQGFARTGQSDAGPRPVQIKARAIHAFYPRRPEQTRFGALTFRGGLELSADDEAFGGFSGLSRSADGRDLVAVSDRGHWLTASVVNDAKGQPQALEQARMAPILNAAGKRVSDTRGFDTEGLCIRNGIAYVSVERTHEVLRFDWARRGVMARGVSLALGRHARGLPRNRSFEAISVAPATSPVANQILTIAERSGGKDDPTMGLLLGGPKRATLEVARRDGYDISDCAFLPSGDLLLLERWYAPWSGVATRIRRVPGRDVVAGATLEGTVIFEADMGHEIDNFEGLAIHQAGQETRLTLISDNNYSALQRTLLMEFALA